MKRYAEKVRRIWARDPAGHLHPRETGRIYSHVVFVKKDDGAWGAIAWCGRLDLALGKKREALRYRPADTVEICEVEKEKA